VDAATGATRSRCVMVDRDIMKLQEFDPGALSAETDEMLPMREETSLLRWRSAQHRPKTCQQSGKEHQIRRI
jgi:hypothetical protein